MAHRLSSQKGKSQIRIFGRTGQVGHFEISGDIQKFANEQLKVIKASSVTATTRFATDDQGRFYFDLILPVGQIQLPLVFKSDSSPPVDIIVSLNISESEIKMDNEKKEFEEKSSVLWLALGGNFLNFKQDFSSQSSTALNFDSFGAPEVSITYQGVLSQNFSLSIEWRQSPGSTRSKEIEVNNGRYSWRSLDLEGLFYANRNFPLILFGGWKSRLHYSLGLQGHFLPYLQRIRQNAVEIKEDRFAFLSFGVGVEAISPLRNWKAKAQLRGMSNVLPGEDLSFQAGWGASFGLGIHKIINDSWSLGLRWDAQMISGKYSGAADRVVGEDAEGSLELFRNSTQMRLSYGW